MEELYKMVFENYRTNYYDDKSPLLNKSELTSNYHNSAIKYANIDNPYFSFVNFTNSKEDYLNNYSNQLCSIFLKKLTFVVEKHTDKVSLKLFNFEKFRFEGKPYFKKINYCMFITYKLKTNDLYYGSISRKYNNKSIVKILRKNYFGGQTPPFSNMFLNLKSSLKNFIGKVVIDRDSLNILEQAMTCFVKNIPNIESLVNFNTNLLLNNNFDYIFFENYLRTRNIKYPDNFKVFIDKTPAPSKKLLKKYDNKFIDCFMHNNKLNGDKIKKILHTATVINDRFYKNLLGLFGDDFIKNQSFDDLKTIFNYKGGVDFKDCTFNGSKIERRRAFAVLIDLILKNKSLSSFIDHIQFYMILKEYEKIKWLSSDSESFSKEHLDWTDKVMYYKKGQYYREYNSEFIIELEKVILDDYYPVVLKNSIDYIEESTTQSNCVKTYINNVDSFIVSVRKGSNLSNERVTIEYKISRDFNKKNGIKLTRTQSLGKYNNSISFSWNTLLTILDERVSRLVNENKFDLPKIRHVSRESNYYSDSGFNNMNRLVWLSPINQNFISDYFF